MPEEKLRSKKVHINETSEVFIKWLEDCKKIVLPGWTLKILNIREYIQVVRENGKTRLPFAFIKKNGGSIHCPALLHGDPYEYERGFINDPETRLSDVTPFGIKAYNRYEPTHPEYSEQKGLDFSAIKS
jgi:hypothetical protein